MEGEYELPPEASNNIYEMTEEERHEAGIQSLPEDLYESVHERAFRDHMSKADVVRNALRRYL